MRHILEIYTKAMGTEFFNIFNPKKAADWVKLAPGAMDNFCTRQLLGREAVNAPHGSINATHLAMAKVSFQLQ
jgi:hypothetical protein